MIASNGHFLTQMPQPMQSSSEIHAIFDVGPTSTHSLPILTTGQLFLHSCLHFLGLHLIRTCVTSGADSTQNQISAYCSSLILADDSDTSERLLAAFVVFLGRHQWLVCSLYSIPKLEENSVNCDLSQRVYQVSGRKAQKVEFTPTANILDSPLSCLRCLSIIVSDSNSIR